MGFVPLLLLMVAPVTNTVDEMFRVFVIRCTSRIEEDITVVHMID